jgi:signal transduction histidine kinase
MGMLVAGVAHEVRNPLFAISANLDAFEAKMGRSAGFDPLVARLRAEVGRLATVMEGLLDYGKLSQLDLATGPIDAVVAESVESCLGLAADRGVTVTMDLAPDLPQVLMDRKRMVQVFQNLLQNAIQHTPSGGAVKVRSAPMDRDEKGRIQLTLIVEDSGKGIAPELTQRVFEPFFSQRRGGTGLGLAIVRRIVEDHGGTVSAGNRPEGGAMMTVRLLC